MTALEELKIRLAEALEEIEVGKASADSLKDHWWLICHSMRAVIPELRERETGEPQKESGPCAILRTAKSPYRNSADRTEKVSMNEWQITILLLLLLSSN